MEIVINIPQGRYEDILSGKYFTMYQCDIREVLKNGTPLPKGHGKLIDVSDIEWAKHREERNYIDYEVIDWDDIVNAPTIIEADKG